jgi:succinate dehydrogenase / fumarate reductase membrane anchor subunit
MANGFIRYITFLFIISLCYHAWVGVRDIWMDYLNSAAVRVILHVLTLLALIGYAGWAVQIIWRL